MLSVASLLKLLQAVGSLLTAFFSYLRDRQLIEAGRTKERLEAADEAERARREREEIDERVRRAGDGTAFDELRRNWSRK